MTATSIRTRPLSWLPILALCALSAGAAQPSRAPQQGRVIVLGFDGADARTAAELMDQGQLPNLAALRDRGTFAPLDTTNPAESPVSWAALNCGQNPAKTGVPGFMRRSLPASGLPTATLGHFDGPREVAIEDFEGTPIPTWGKSSL